MIDSGSDIVTLDDDVIKELKLPVIGRCQQEVAGGVTREVPVHNACLGIGEKKLNITVRRLQLSRLNTRKIQFRVLSLDQNFRLNNFLEV